MNYLNKIKKRNSNLVRTIAVISALLLFSSNLKAEIVWVTDVSVSKVLVDEFFGGCMIRVNVELPETCGVGWVSLDCDGTYYDQRNGENKFAAALMAESGDKLVDLAINDSFKHGPYCTARRLDVK